MLNKDRLDKSLYLFVIALIVSLVALNVYMVVRFNQEMVVRPREVIETIEERLAVTPQMVMNRLNEIEASHMKWVEEHRDLKANENVKQPEAFRPFEKNTK